MQARHLRNPHQRKVVWKVVFLKTILPQIRQLVLYYSVLYCQVDGCVGKLTLKTTSQTPWLETTFERPWLR